MIFKDFKELEDKSGNQVKKRADYYKNPLQAKKYKKDKNEKTVLLE